MSDTVYLALVRRPGRAATHKSVHQSHSGAIEELHDVTDTCPLEADHTFKRGGNQHRLTRWSYIHRTEGENLIQRVEKKELKI